MVFRRLWNFMAYRWKVTQPTAHTSKLIKRLEVLGLQCTEMSERLDRKELELDSLKKELDKLTSDLKRSNRQYQEAVDQARAELTVADMQLTTLTTAYQSQLARYQAEMAIQTRVKMAAGMIHQE